MSMAAFTRIWGEEKERLDEFLAHVKRDLRIVISMLIQLFILLVAGTGWEGCGGAGVTCDLCYNFDVQ